MSPLKAHHSPELTLHYQDGSDEGLDSDSILETAWGALDPDRVWRAIHLGPLPVPTKGPLSCGIGPIPIHPYILGYLLGDGCLVGSSVAFSTGDEEVAQIIGRLLAHPYWKPVDESRLLKTFAPARLESYPGFPCTVSSYGQFSYAIVSRSRPNPLKAVLSQMGVWGHKWDTKRIPKMAFEWPIAARQWLLWGLMDSDGSASGGYPVFTSGNRDLAYDVGQLWTGLGGAAILRTSKRGESYTTLNGPIRAFCLSRKYHLQRIASKLPYRWIVGASKDGSTIWAPKRKSGSILASA